MREIDVFPCQVITPTANYHPVRLIADRLDNTLGGGWVIRIYQREGSTRDINHILTTKATARHGTLKKGSFDTPEGIFNFGKTGGCGCSDPLKTYQIPNLTEEEMNEYAHVV